MSEKLPKNPGKWVFLIGLLVILGEFVIMAVSTPSGEHPTTGAVITFFTTIGLVIFISSVVAAYYAGKRR